MFLSPTDAMKSDYNSVQSVFNDVSMFAPILLIFVMCLTVFYKLRMRWPVKVNCWFCNKNSKIWRLDLDWWLCSWCQQYNGFSKNGDYAYDIPEQRATSNICTRYCRLAKQSNMHNIVKNNLCTYCNEQESLKLLELPNFEPKSEKLYNIELKTFKEYLEKKYPLCINCKLMVQGVLNKQALWLTHYKMLFFRQKPIQTLISNTKKSEIIFRTISTVLASIVAYNHDFTWLPISGLFFHLCTYWSSSMKRKKYNILLIFLWLCIIILVSIKNLTALQNAWLTTEHIVQYRMITVCAFIMGFVILKSSWYKDTLTSSLAFKKLKRHSSDAFIPQSMYNNQIKDKNILNEMDNSIESSIYAGELSSTEIKSHSAMLRQKLSTITVNNGNSGYLNSVSQNENGLPNNLNDSLSTLFLSEDSPNYSRNAKAAPAIFERRVYSATSSENLFRKSSNLSNKRYILSPPKLRSVTQTSWVAGGYWQEGMMTATPPTLSRSSSQSSGFGSAGSSNLAPSREPSVHELDRCSVVSDATRWSCHTSRPNVANHVVRCGSPVPRARYGDATSRRHSQSMPSPAFHAMHSAENHVQENYVCGSNVGKRHDSVPVFRDHHTTTVIANPGWLSALLCVSLILNMIVLCTTLLR